MMRYSRVFREPRTGTHEAVNGSRSAIRSSNEGLPMKLRTYTALAAASALALTLAACGKKAEEVTPAADTAVTPPALS